MTIGVHDWDYCTLLILGHDISTRAWTFVVMVWRRCHMPGKGNDDKFHAFFLSFLCYKTYSFSKIHSIVHSNVHYCSLSFTLTMVLLFCIHIICNFVIVIERGLRMMKVWRSFSARRFSCRWRTFSARHSNQASLLLCSRLGVLWHVGTKSGKNLKCVVNKLKVAEKAVT